MESHEITLEDLTKLTRDIKNKSLDLSKYGIFIEQLVEFEYVVKEAFKAGTTAALISTVFAIAPEIYKAIHRCKRENT